MVPPLSDAESWTIADGGGAPGVAASIHRGGGTTGLGLVAGSLTLSGANTCTGGTTIDGGRLAAGAAGALVDYTDYVVNDGVLDLGGFNLIMSSLSGTGGEVALGSAGVMAKGMLGWRHVHGDATPDATMRFASGGDTFSIGGVPIARDTAVIEAGLDYALTPTATLGVSYGGQFGSGMSGQSVKADFNVRF